MKNCKKNLERPFLMGFLKLAEWQGKREMCIESLGVGTLPENQETSPTAFILYYPYVVVSSDLGTINESEKGLRLYIEENLF